MEEESVLRDRIALSCKVGHVPVDAAEKKAKPIGVPECIAVVDAGGEMLAFSRMGGARCGSIESAITKGRSAARRRRATAEEAGGNALAGIEALLA